MKSKGKWLVVSIVLAFATSTLLLQLLKSNAVEQTVASPKRQVVVATAEIGERQVLEPAMLQVIEVSADAVHPHAITTLEEAVRAVTRQRIVAGEMLLEEMVVHTDDPSRPFAMKVPVGKRAVAVANSELIGVGGLLLPGDRVDVVAAYEKNKLDGKQDMAKVVLQDIEVLAIGTKSSSIEPEAPMTDSEGTKNSKTDSKKQTKELLNTTITLAVTPAQAESLMFAETFGTVRLALRGVQDNAKPETTGVGNTSALQVR